MQQPSKRLDARVMNLEETRPKGWHTLVGIMVLTALAIPAANLNAQATPPTDDQASSLSPGLFLGSDSLTEGAPRRAVSNRRALTGRATWRIETDTVDLRRKVTVRVRAIDAELGATIVLRGVDTLGRWPAYDGRAPNRGAMGTKLRTSPRSELRVTLRDTTRSYQHSLRDLVLVGSSAGTVRPIVRGRFIAAGQPSYAWPLDPEQPKYWLTGQFVAVHDASPAPVVTVTEVMQRAVLERAVLSFLLTHSEMNVYPQPSDGDDYRDSVQTTAGARRFLLKHWGHAVRIDTLTVKGKDFQVRLRGLFINSTCEAASPDKQVVCSPPTDRAT